MAVQIELTNTLTQERLHSLNLGEIFLVALPRFPGLLIDTQQILEPWQDFYPTIFIAFDVATHLQVGNIYLLRNVASAVDFIHFVQRGFSFRVREISRMLKNHSSW